MMDHEKSFGQDQRSFNMFLLINERNGSRRAGLFHETNK